MGYSIRIDEIEPARPGGAVRFVRRELGVKAFGIDWFEAPPNVEGRKHDETDSGQEEVNAIVRGSGVYRIEDEEVPVAGPGGFAMVAIGARRGSYEPRGPF